MANVYNYVPDAQGMELAYLNNVVTPMSDETARMFFQVYIAQRKQYNIMLLLCLIGFLSIAGLHRFYTNDIGMGVLYVLTGGLCLIGTIVDLINLRNMTDNINIGIAQSILQNMHQ